MNVALAVVAGVTVAGAVLAVSARDVRATVLGVLIVLLAAPLVASPWPGPLPILARIAAALLAARLLTIGLRDSSVTGGSRIGWPAEALAAAAAAVIGYGSHGLGAAALGPAEAQAAGFGLIAVAITPLVTGRDVLRLGVGSLLLVVGALLIRVGLDRPAGEGEQLIVGLLTIGLGGAVGVIAAAARAAGGLEIANRPAERRAPRPPDAHREAPRAMVPPAAPSLRPAPGRLRPSVAGPPPTPPVVPLPPAAPTHVPHVPPVPPGPVPPARAPKAGPGTPSSSPPPRRRRVEPR